MAQRRSPPASVAAPQGAVRGGPRIARLVYSTALALSVAWAAAVIAFAWSVGAGAFFQTIWGVAALAMIAFGPCGMIYAAAYLVHQAEVLAAHDRQVLTTLEDMVAPAHAAGVSTAQVLDDLRRGIAQGTAAAETAAGAMVTLRSSLSVESDRLNGAAVASLRTAGELAATLEAQRQAYDEFLARFDTRIAEIAATLSARSSAAGEGLAQATGRLELAVKELASLLDRSQAAADSSLVGLERAAAGLRGVETTLSGELDGLCDRLTGQAGAIRAATEQVHAEREALRWGVEAIAGSLSQHLGSIRSQMAEIPERLSRLSAALAEHAAVLERVPAAPWADQARPSEPPAVLAEAAPAPSRLKLFAVEAAEAEPQWAVSATRGPADDVAHEFAASEGAPPPPASGGEALEQRLRAELAAWGIQPGRAIPKRQLDDACRLVAAGQAAEARERVAAAAGSVVRRLAQRAAAHPQFGRDAQAYVEQFARENLQGGGEGAAESLGSGAGRLYLLLDAALGGRG